MKGTGTISWEIKRTKINEKLLTQFKNWEIYNIEYHHFLTNKNLKWEEYSNKMKTILDEYNLDFEQDFNWEFIANHKGRHWDDYNKAMLDIIKKIKNNANWDQKIFKELFEEEKFKIVQDPKSVNLDIWIK